MAMLSYWQVADSPGSHQAQTNLNPQSNEGSMPDDANCKL